MTRSKLIPSIHVTLTIGMHKALKQKRKDGYSMAGYVRAAIERQLREDGEAIEEAG